MEYQHSPFKPIRNFDLPSVALNQILTNEMSLGSMRDLLLPSRRAYLSPAQQESLTEKIKDKYGGENRIARTMLGIATNPWIWLGAAVSPPAMEAVRRSGSIFSAGRNVAKSVSGQDGAFLQPLGVLSSHHALDGTLAGIALEVDIALRNRAHAIDAKAIEESLAKYYASNPHSLTSVGAKKAPRDLDEWLQIVAKKNMVPKPHRVTERIFHPQYTGEYKDFADTIKKSIALDLQKASQSTTHKIPHLEAQGNIWVDSEAAAKAVGAKWTGGGWAEIPVRGKNSWDYFNKQNAKAFAKGLDEPYKIRLDGSNAKIRWETRQLGDGYKVLIEEPVAKAIREQYHLEPIVKAYRASYDQRAAMLFGDDFAYKSGGFINNKGEREFIFGEAGKNKLKTIIASLDPTQGKSMFNKGAAGELVESNHLSAEGIDFLRSILPIEEFSTMSMGMNIAKKHELFETMVKDTVSSLYNQGIYLPRNTFRDVYEYGMKNGLQVKQAGSMKANNPFIDTAENLSKLNRLAPRASATRNLHPEDYEFLMNMNKQHGGSVENYQFLKDKLGKTVQKIEQQTADGVASYSYTLDGVTGKTRYMKDTSEIYSRNIPHEVWNPATRKLTPDTEVWGELMAADLRIRKGGLPAGGGTPMGGDGGLFDMNTKWREGDIPRSKLPTETRFKSLDMNTTLEDLVLGKEIAHPFGGGSSRPMKNMVGAPKGGVTLGDVMSHQYAAMTNTHTKALFKDVILPHVSGRIIPKQSASRALQIKTHEMVHKFARGGMGKMIEGWGPYGKDFISNLKSMSTYESLNGVMAKGLYVGFLGANMMSVMLNMMQPLLHAAMWGGLENVIPAYKDAFKEIMGYAKERFPLGLRISDAKRAELMGKHFSHVGEGLMGDLLGVAPSVFANIDGATYAGVQSFGKEGMGKFLSMTLPMKMFEKAELMNRLVSAHTVNRIHNRAGITRAARPTGLWNQEEKNLYTWMTDSRRFVQEAQFGGSPLNMPTAFIGDDSIASGLVSNPLGRQFLSFITRAFSSYAVAGKQISPERYFREGIPVIGGKKIIGGHLGADLFRAMGTGALGYEIFKEMAHMDMSRGLGVQPLFEVMGGGWVPPVVAIPTDMVKVAMGDLEFAKSSIPGVMPMGIAFTRAMGMMPAADETPFVPDLARQLQKTYVDWNTTTPDGLHPVFSGDGRLINYEKPFSIIAGGLGLNLENHPKAGEVDGYLAKQRELITQMESEYMNALIANNVPKARKIQAQFEDKFNLPLKVSKSQWRSRMRNLETARLERIANTIPSEYKELYQSTIAEEYQRIGMVDKEQALSGQTSGQRTKAGASRTSPVKLDPATISEIKKHLQSQEQQEKPTEDQGFNPFQTWNK